MVQALTELVFKTLDSREKNYNNVLPKRIRIELHTMTISVMQNDRKSEKQTRKIHTPCFSTVGYRLAVVLL